jgi:hypothetical protein
LFGFCDSFDRDNKYRSVDTQHNSIFIGQMCPFPILCRLKKHCCP